MKYYLLRGAWSGLHCNDCNTEVVFDYGTALDAVKALANKHATTCPDKAKSGFGLVQLCTLRGVEA